MIGAGRQEDGHDGNRRSTRGKTNDLDRAAFSTIPCTDILLIALDLH